MNKFKNLTSKLIQNKLWANRIRYIKMEYEEVDLGMPQNLIIDEVIEIFGIVKNVSKNLVDNVNIFTTDASIVIDVKTLGRAPSKQDLVVINADEEWKIIAINALGMMDNEPAAYEIVIRVA